MPTQHTRKMHPCTYEGCGKTFQRSDHLQRHILNHTAGNSTCPRCSAHFKRRDLLDRHLARHRQKDEEAGGEGLGVVCTRKRLWRDADGNLVSKRPKSLSEVTSSEAGKDARQLMTVTQDENALPQSSYQSPISPPPSLSSNGVTVQEDFGYDPNAFDFQHVFDLPQLDEPMVEDFDFFSDIPWGAPIAQPMNDSASSSDAMLDDIFSADTASSFNMPFTTERNYNWLFERSQENEQNSASHGPAELSSSEPSDIPRLIVPRVIGSVKNIAPDFRAPPAQVAQMSSSRSLSVDHSPATSQQLIGNYMAGMNDSNLLGQSSSHSTTYGSHGCHSFCAITSTDKAPIVDKYAMNRVLDVISQARPRTPDGAYVTRDHPLLSLEAMQAYCECFFTRFNKQYPLIHRPTFDPSTVDPLLLLSILLLGATYGSKEAHRLAVCIHDIMRIQIFQSPAFAASPRLWILQVILLTECFGKSRAGQKQHDMSHLYHGLLINLIRRSDCQTACLKPSSGAASIEDRWRDAIDVEQRKRLALLCFQWDVQHALLFSQSLCMSAFELRTSLPCSPQAWEAETAAEWSMCDSGPEPSFLATLKIFMNPDVLATPPELNALSRLLILHGLMSIHWDMKRRDQTSLGSSGPATEWQSRLSASYDMWKRDFDTYCMNMTLQLKSSPVLKACFTRFSTSTRAIYHAAQLVLNVEVLDLQIYAGAQHILGRPVAPHDFQRSRKQVKHWASVEAPAAATAAWHAAMLLRDGVMELEDFDTNQTFHYPWCLYLATLTCWAFHRVPHDQDQQPERKKVNEPAKNEWKEYSAAPAMNSLISSMAAAQPDGIARLAGKLDSRGLVSVIAQQLGGIRWAVIHEGMKVLKAL